MAIAHLYEDNLLAFMLLPLDLCNRCHIKLVNEADADFRCP